MKNYTITVNGTAYDVSVEETGAGAALAAAPAVKKAAPAPHVIKIQLEASVEYPDGSIARERRHGDIQRRL